MPKHAGLGCSDGTCSRINVGSDTSLDSRRPPLDSPGRQSADDGNQQNERRLQALSDVLSTLSSDSPGDATVTVGRRHRSEDGAVAGHRSVAAVGKVEAPLYANLGAGGPVETGSVHPDGACPITPTPSRFA